MLAYRTGLSAAVCKAWIEATIVKSAEAVKAAFQPDTDVMAARSEIETYALARVKYRQGGSLQWTESYSRVD